MKLFLAVIAIIIAATGLVSAQSTKQNDALEQEIRKLEQAQVNALLQNDLAAMKRNWAKDYIVNNPFSQAVKASGRSDSHWYFDIFFVHSRD